MIQVVEVGDFRSSTGNALQQATLVQLPLATTSARGYATVRLQPGAALMSPIEPTDITPPRRDQSGLHLADVPAAVLQAWYHHLTKRTEEMFDYFTDRYIFSYEDIVNFGEKFSQTCAQFQIEAINSEVHVSFSDKTKQSFSSFDKFREIEKTKTASVLDCEIIFNFHIKVPQSPEFQPYKLQMFLRKATPAKDVSDEDEFFSSVPSNFPAPSVICRIGFVDYVVARSFKQLIREWVATLEQFPKNNFLAAVYKYRKPIGFWIPTLSVLAGFYGALSLVGLIVSPNDLRTLAAWVAWFFFIIIASTLVGGFSEDALARQADRYRRASYFKITSGDDKEIAAFRASRSGALVKTVAFCGVILVNIVANLIASAIVPAVNTFVLHLKN